MFPPSTYLHWIQRAYDNVTHDLATSGSPSIPLHRFGTSPLREDVDGDDLTGWPRLRTAIARYHGVSEDEAIATLGTSQALWVAYASMVAPGDEVLVESPAYEALCTAAGGVGARVTRFERSPRDGYRLDIGTVTAKLSDRTRVVSVTNAHNPTGVRASDESIAALAAELHRRNVYLLVDEVYAPFDDFVTERGTWETSARTLGPNVVVASSLTKAFGVGPYRVGWVLGPPEVIARARDVILGSCGNLPLWHAHLALQVFDHLPALAAQSRESLLGKREVVDAWMASRSDLEWSQPPAGLFGFAIAPGRGDLKSIIEKGAREHGVLVVPGCFFGIPNGFRIAWSLPREQLAPALLRLERVLAT